MALSFHHLGIVVKDIDAAGKLYSDMLGFKLWEGGVKEDIENGVKLLSLVTNNTFIELVQPTRPDNRFGRFLEEKGEGLFHLCFNSDDFEGDVNKWREKGFDMEEEMANSHEDPFKLVWITPRSTTGVWLELCDH